MILAKTSAKLDRQQLLFAALSVSVLLVATFGGVASQATDGDEQFQAYHHDIGRISATQADPVAPSTTTVTRPHEQLVAPPPVVAVAARARTLSPPPPSSVRKHNRVTLVPVRGPHETLLQPPAVSTTLLDSSVVVAEQPPLAPVAVTAALPKRLHSASMAQVAAERQADEISAHDLHLQQQQQHHHHLHQQQQQLHRGQQLRARQQQQHHHQHQASLGSPLVALSSPPLAQVPPPPLATSFESPVAAASPAVVRLPVVAAAAVEEPIIAQPSFEQVLSQGCPSLGLFSYENRDHCDRYYMCTNGTFTEEACPNGLVYGQMGAVYQHCTYNWKVDCGPKKTAAPLASPGCPWQFGIFPIAQAGACATDYAVCEWGVPETRRCSPAGLFYDDRIKGCQWPDQLGCKSEGLLNFRCPPEDEANAYWPFPRYYHSARDIIVCVNEQPRLVFCDADQAVDPNSLACIDLVSKRRKPVRLQ